MKLLLLFGLMFSLIACSGSKKAIEDAVENETGVELSDADEFNEDGEESEDGDAVSEGLEEEGLDEEDGEEVADADEVEEDVVEEVSEASTGGSPVMISDSGEQGSYTVKFNDTLMLVAFKIYGDYEKWRTLARANAGKLGPGYTISEGMILSYPMPTEKFVWNPEGNPYLIKRGDTLGLISQTTYGTRSRWRAIWKNNSPLIKDPNRIFAGFTIYTPLMDGRDVANE